MKQNLKKINSFNKAIKKKRWAKRLISSFTLECPHACAWMNPRGAESTCVASYNQQPRFEEQINHQHAFPLNSAMLSLPVTHRNGVAWNVMILQTTFFIFCSSSPLFPWIITVNQRIRCERYTPQHSFDTTRGVYFLPSDIFAASQTAPLHCCLSGFLHAAASSTTFFH